MMIIEKNQAIKNQSKFKKININTISRYIKI